MAARIRRLARPIREFGLVAGILYGIDRVFVRARSGLRLFYYELMVQPVREGMLVPGRMSMSTEIRELESDDPHFDRIPPPPSVVASRFKQNAVCLGAFQKGEFIAYQWLCLGQYIEDEVRCTYVPMPAAHAAFDFDIYIFPDYRLGLGFAKMWDGTNKYLRAQGIRYTFSRVSRFNSASRRAHQHLGAQRVGRAIFLSAKRLQLTVSTIPPYIHMSIGDSPGPRFILRANMGESNDPPAQSGGSLLLI